MNHIIRKNFLGLVFLFTIAGLIFFLPFKTEAATTYGPQSNIICPQDAVSISPGQDISALVDSYPNGTTFCVQAGTYSPTQPINLKAGDKLIGQYGAIIDGTNVAMTYDISSTSIIRGWNCGIDCSNVLLQNLIIRNLAAHNCIGIYSSSQATPSNNWTVDHNEVYGCDIGMNIGMQSGARITNNEIHNNFCWGGGYRETNTTWDNNEISFSSMHGCKWADDYQVGYSTNVTVTNNDFHDFAPDTAVIWFDTLGSGNIISGNTIMGASNWPAVDVEATTGTTIYGNTITLPADGSDGGIFVTNSKNTDIHNNTFNAPAGGGAQVFWDGVWSEFPVSNNYVHNNTLVIGGNKQLVGYQCSVVSPSDCANSMLTNKNLFNNNTYQVPDLTGAYWHNAGSSLPWIQWQSAGQDQMGTQSSGPTPDTISPSVPTGLTATTASLSQINLSWSAAPDNVGTTGYKIFRNGDQINSSTGTSYSDTGLAQATTYLYKVSAYDAAGNNSADSSVVSATTLASLPPAPSVSITSVKVKTTRDSATISWTTNRSSTGKVTLRPGRSLSDTNSLTSHTVNFTNLSRNRRYSYTIVATNGDRTSTRSASFRTAGR